MIKIMIRYRKLLLFIAAIFFIVIGLFVTLAITNLLSPEATTKNEIAKKVSENIGRQDFKVEQVLVESDGWYLAKISSTREVDVGNKALVILQKRDNNLVLKFGPGTSFDKEELMRAGIPNVILDALFGDQEKYFKDPIESYLPHTTNFYSIKSSSASGVDYIPGTKVTLITTIYEVPHLGIYATPEKKVEYQTEINNWIKSLGLDPSNYTVFFTK